jgi:putative tryptophan/tyrosine transport system substrate-binding protein
MQRRQFLIACGAVGMWPLNVLAEGKGGARRVGLLLPAVRSDTEYPSLVAAFVAAIRDLGRTEDQLQITVRWGTGEAAALRKAAAELLAELPDIILASGASSVGPLLALTRSVPIVFVVVPDPVGAGFAESLARPGGNATGFSSFEYGIGSKWLELLQEIAPKVNRVAVLREAGTTAGVGQWSAIQTAAQSLRLEVSPINLADPVALERQVAEFARLPNGGLIVTSSGQSVRHRALIVRLAAQHRLPALYYAKAFIESGGLISFGPDRHEQFRRAAGYVDRILKGEKPGEMPIQAPTIYEIVVNLKTANQLGLTVPLALLARANEVIE